MSRSEEVTGNQKNLTVKRPSRGSQCVCFSCQVGIVAADVRPVAGSSDPAVSLAASQSDNPPSVPLRWQGTTHWQRRC